MSASSNPETAKASIRAQLREALKGLSPEQRVADSLAMNRRLTERREWIEARSVLLFVPVASEPDIWPLAEQARAAGKTMVLPRFVPDLDGYQACVFGGGPNDLIPGRFNIPEPAPYCPLYDLMQLDLALVPGIGFTLDGGRLGRGKGYFDRLLADVPGFKCGVAFDSQIVPALPLEPHDVRLNCILTPTRWLPVVCPPRS